MQSRLWPCCVRPTLELGKGLKAPAVCEQLGISDELADTFRRQAFLIEALDPHPATESEGVTHPHVRDEMLCTGEASSSISAALEAGRIADFFLIVRSVLTTYNPESPYVSLDNWNGEPCVDCGYYLNDDNRYFCEECEEHFCDECMSGCPSYESIQDAPEREPGKAIAQARLGSSTQALAVSGCRPH